MVIKNKKSLENKNERFSKLSGNGIGINKKKPSGSLITLIKDFGHSCDNLEDLAGKIKEKGHDEGFNDFEIILLAREVLREFLTRRQLNYWFPTRKNSVTRMEESTGQHLQEVHIDGKKGLEDLCRPTLATEKGEDSNNDVPVGGITINSEQKFPNQNADNTIESKTKSAKLITYLDLVDPGMIDCTSHPMYQKARDRIEQLTRELQEKSGENKQLSQEIIERT